MHKTESESFISPNHSPEVVIFNGLLHGCIYFHSLYAIVSVFRVCAWVYEAFSLTTFSTEWLYIKLNFGLPWWHSGWESACQCRGHGFEPWSGKIPHAAEQLRPWATTTELARLEPVLRNKRGRASERPAHRDEEWPPLAATRESPRTETKTQHSQK